MNLITPAGNTQTFDNSFTPQPLPETATQEPSFWSQVWDGLSRIMSDATTDNFQPQDVVGSMPAPYMPNIPFSSPAVPESSTSLQERVNVAQSVIGDAAYRISSGFSWAKSQLRNGDPHPAVDIAVPVGTPVQVPQRAGNFVKVSTTLTSGDVYEATYAHLSSIDVAKGDVITPQSVIAKSGNTGNSTGPHLHFALKKNGKPIDPTSVDIGDGQGASQNIAPQQLVQPTIRTYQEQYDDIRNFLFGGMSGDIWHNDGGLF